MTLHLSLKTLSTIIFELSRILKTIFCLVFFFYSGNSIANKTDKPPLSVTSTPIVMGYYSQWAIYSPNIHIQDLQAHFMTHLVYKSAYLSHDGTIKLGDAFADIEHLYPTVNIEKEKILGSFGQLIKLKNQQPELKNIISIGGWKRSENFSFLSSTDAGRKKIAKSAIDFMKEYQFDGIEIDWQFPIYRSITPTDMQFLNHNDDPHNLELLLEELKTQCDELTKKCWLQVVLAPYSIDEIEQAQLLNKSTDAIVVDVSRIYGDSVELTDHLSPLYAKPEKRSINQTMIQLKSSGIQANKIVMAIPSFSVGWDGVSSVNNGLQQSPQKNSWGSWDSKPLGETGVYNQKSLSFFLASKTYSLHWDDYAKMSYLYDSQKFGGHFITFESERSIAEKVNYVEKNHLAGIAIRQLHNGGTVLKHTFHNFHFWSGSLYKISDLWNKNRNILIAIFQFLVILSIFAFVTFFLMNKRYSLIAKDKIKFSLLRKNLQSLEWPLLNLLTISSQLQQKSLIDNKTAKDLFSASSGLLHPTSIILSESKFNNTMTQQPSYFITLDELLKTTDSLLFINKQRHLSWECAINCQLFIDPTSLQQFFYNVCFLCCENTALKENIRIKIIVNDSFLDLTINAIEKNNHQNLNHAQLKILIEQANTLGLSIKKISRSMLSFSVRFPSPKYMINQLEGLNFSFEQNLDSELENKGLKEKRELNATSSGAKNIIQQVGAHESNTEHESDLINNIELFNMSSIPSKDIHKGFEQACSFFINFLQQDSKMTIYQNEQLLSELGNDALYQGYERIINSNDFIIKIVTDKKLSSEEEQLIQVLIYQTQMIQKAIKSLVKEPTILAELYELTRFKDQIKYLKAESGYTGIYLQSKKDPRYISMRLRTIKLYFDDNSLIQIHRSYIINVKKVSHVESISKLKYRMVIGSEKLPISRTYISSLKETYPHWFE
jgi:chitinase